MKKGAIAAVAVIAVLSGGVAIGYPMYKGYVEDQAAAWLRAGGGQTVPGSAEFDSLSADIFANTITVEGYRFAAEDGSEVKVGDAAITHRNHTIRINRVEAQLETTYFLTPIERIVRVTADGIRNTWTTVLPSGRTQDNSAAFERFRMTDASLPNEGVASENPITDVGSLDAVIEQLRQQQFAEAEIIGIRIESADFPQPIELEAARMTGLSEGRVDTFGIHGFEFEENDGRIDLGALVFRDLDTLSILELIAESERTGTEPEPADIFDAMGLSAIEVENLDVQLPEGGQTSIGSLVFDSFTHYQGIPSGLRIAASDVVQTVPPEMVRRQMAAIPFPIALDIPEQIETRSEIAYSMDMAADRMRISVTSYDSFTGVDMDLTVSLGGLSPMFDALAAGGQPQQLERTAALVNATLVLKGDTWDPPQMVGGRPSPRLFALEYLAQFPMPVVIDEAVLTPVRAFLRGGGTFTLTMTPGQPLTLRRLQMLANIQPEQALRRAGLSVTHE
jgi:hypothetical protein